ncbi:MAG: hypothetical protein K8I30_12645 [Anaerolineae bacterium]|nr:hypothetical protein [Anaerolineae bacterium]
MFQPYLKVVAVCGFICILLTFAAQVFGASQMPIPPVHAFLTGCEDKPQPCWFGVRPGITRQAELLSLMAFAGQPRFGSLEIGTGINVAFTLSPPSPYCHADFSVVEDIVLRAELSLCRQPGIQVGDLAILWSEQSNVMSLPPYELVYGSTSVNVEGWPTPYSRVLYIIMLAPDSKIYRYPWRGFVSQDRYCQLVPRFPRCRNWR